LNDPNHGTGKIPGHGMDMQKTYPYKGLPNSSMIDHNYYTFTIENINNNCGQALTKYDTSFVYKKINITKMSIIDTNTLAIKLSEMPLKTQVYIKENYLLNNNQLPSYILINPNGFHTGFT